MSTTVPPILKLCPCKAIRKYLKIDKFCNQFVLNKEELIHIKKIFICELEKGLKKVTRPFASVKAIPTYIHDFPSGKEHGKFLALSLGVDVFRIVLLQVIFGKPGEIKVKTVDIPPYLKIGTGQHLFDFVATSLHEFTKEHKVAKDNLPLAFTISFPVDQLGIAKGNLIKWTKGYNCSGVVGKDVVALLSSAIKRIGTLQVNIVALVNNTVGALISCALNYDNCLVGIIVGNGSNSCHREPVSNMDTFTPESDKPYVIINNEWGGFGDNGCINFVLTEFDRIVDAKSRNPGQQTFEKMVAGLYLGEIARLAIRCLVRKNLLFNGKTSNILEKQNTFSSSYLADMDVDNPEGLENCHEILKKFDLDQYANDEDCKNIRYVCSTIAKRSAHLVAALTSALIERINLQSVITVAIDGSIYRYHTQYRNHFQDKIRELIGPNLDFQIVLSEDDIGKGAAALAAILS